MRMEHLLYLLLLHSICHLFIGWDWQTWTMERQKNKGFIVQYVRLQLSFRRCCRFRNWRVAPVQLIGNAEITPLPKFNAWSQSQSIFLLPWTYQNQQLLHSTIKYCMCSYRALIILQKLKNTSKSHTFLQRKASHGPLCVSAHLIPTSMSLTVLLKTLTPATAHSNRDERYWSWLIQLIKASQVFRFLPAAVSNSLTFLSSVIL